MKKIGLLICFAVSHLSNAQTPSFESVKLADNSTSATSQVTDAAGNVYATGGLWGTTDFQPGAGEFLLVGGTSRSPVIFVSKVNSSGKLEWAIKIGQGGFHTGESIAIDNSGNIFVTGYFTGAVDFDPGVGVYNLGDSKYLSQAFILKLNPSGTFLWAKAIGIQHPTYGRSITLDAKGNIYCVGIFKGTEDFDLGPGISNLTSTVTDGYTHTDMFVLKMDPAGNFVWARNWYGVVSEEDHSIAVDASGNVYTTGSFSGKVDFDPGKEKSYLTSKGTTDIFISKLDASGNFSWAKSIGGKLEDEGNSIAVDVAGKIYITGFFSETVDFDPGKGEKKFTAPGSYGKDEKKDIFIAKYDGEGSLIWAIQMGGDHSDYGTHISVDSNNNIFVEGRYDGNIDFDPGQGTFFLKPEQAGYYGRAGFMLKLTQK